MTYVESAVIPVPTNKRAAYLDMAKPMRDRAIEAGAIDVMEAWGSDVPDGEITSFRKAVQATDDETIVLSWIIWPNKAACEAGRPKIMADMGPSDFPFDPTRMIFGGFEPMLDD
ncbi:MAG: DUF1428 domain-containing protein [Alphaproteobacteria bacterium]